MSESFHSEKQSKASKPKSIMLVATNPNGRQQRSSRNATKSYPDGMEYRGKKTWTAEEDKTLKELVQTYGVGNWSILASQLTSRTGKQCRERWLIISQMM